MTQVWGIETQRVSECGNPGPPKKGGGMEVELNTQERERNILEFTGNWFFDLGILGFVNLMEEVYGWGLEELKEKIRNLTKNEINALFAAAFFGKIIKDTSLSWVRKPEIFSKTKLKKYFDLEIKSSKIEKLLKNAEEEIESILKEGVKKLSRSADKINQDYIIEIIYSINEEIKNILINKFSKYKEALKKIFASNKKTILENCKTTGLIAYHTFFTNSFFNPAKNKKGREKEIIRGIFKMLNNYFVRDEIPNDVVDKGLSLFLYSSSLRNEYYGKIVGLRDLDKFYGINPVYYIVSFPFAFIYLRDRKYSNLTSNYCFYMNNLKLTYNINKKIKALIEKMDTNSADRRRYTIFRITWRSIIDELIENKSLLSLDNMYIIEYKSVKNQQIAGVEYIGITKLRAKILSDDNIRDKLNTILKIKRGKNDKDLEDVWVLEELIKHKPLFPIVMNHINYIITNLVKVKNQKKKLQFSPKSNLLYALSTDLVLGGIEKENKGESVFSEEFFEKYLDVCEEIKRTKRNLSYIGSLVSNIFRKINNDERTKLISSLFSILIKGNRSSFVNTLLKQILNQNLEEKNSNFFDLMIRFILNNDEGWRHYALSIIIGLTYSGGEENND